MFVKKCHQIYIKSTASSASSISIFSASGATDMTSSEVLWYCPLNFAFKAHQTDAFYFQMGTIFFTGSMQPDDKDRKTSHQPWASKARHLKINLILLPLFSSSLVNIWSASGPVSKCKSYGFSLVFYTKRKKERLWGEPREKCSIHWCFLFLSQKTSQRIFSPSPFSLTKSLSVFTSFPNGLSQQYGERS